MWLDRLYYNWLNKHLITPSLLITTEYLLNISHDNVFGLFFWWLVMIQFFSNKIQVKQIVNWLHRCTQGGEGERGRGAPRVPPQKTLKNCNMKMQSNTKIEYPLPDFLTTPSTLPPKRIWKWLHLWLVGIFNSDYGIR